MLAFVVEGGYLPSGPLHLLLRGVACWLVHLCGRPRRVVFLVCFACSALSFSFLRTLFRRDVLPRTFLDVLERGASSLEKC